jgi:hypothetical protein
MEKHAFSIFYYASPLLPFFSVLCANAKTPFLTYAGDVVFGGSFFFFFSRGNAFALFLKSQRKWQNPPLSAEHTLLFKSRCAEHNYDAARYV